MKKRNGHSDGHAESKLHYAPGSPPTTCDVPTAQTLMPVRHGLEPGEGRPLIGHAPRPWERARFATRARHVVPPAPPVLPAERWQPAASKHPALPRIVLQPIILNSVPIGDNGEQGIGLHVREGGVTVQVEPWSPMQVGDVLDLFWGAPDDPQSPGYPGVPVASKPLQFPEELNKPVLLSVPEQDVVAGWFNVLCRVTRASNGYQELSPRVRVRVKLDRPGGIDPAPDENPNLAAPILPPEVINNGVDTAWAARGVPVTIAPYPNMAVGDRIRLNWGGAFVEYTLRDSSEVDQPVTLIVDEATIRAAGDGDALVLRYQVHDVVHNRSGWSPTTEVVVNVQGNALFLPEVTQADANGVIDLAQLGGEDVRVLVTAFAPDFALGDEVTLQWTGHTAEGVPVPYEETQPVTRGPVQTLEFFVPNASVVALAQGDAVVSYRLQNGRTSKQVRVTIVGDAVTLPAPTVDEAVEDELDASAPRATVRIPPYPGMDVGDLVTLVWSGLRADGQAHLYQIERTISGSAVNKEVVLVVPSSEIALLADGTVTVWYEVMIGDGTPLPPSQTRTLRVGNGQGLILPAPSVDEAPDNALLDPNAVDLYAHVRIAPYTGMAIGDRVDMSWIGSGPNGSFSDWITIGAATLNKPVLFDVDKAYVDANDGGTVMVRYMVTPQGGRARSSTTLTLRVGVAQTVPAISSVTDSQGEEVPQGGTTHDTAVTLSGSAAADMRVELFDHDSTHGVVDVDSAGLWTRGVTGLADGNHSFTAKGLYGSEPVSLARSFTVAAVVVLAAPVVTEADPYSDALNLLKPINGAHVVINYDGMAIGDKVTMKWEGTAGSGSTSQVAEIKTLGPVSFTVANTTITPNQNKTVRIYYTVQRAATPERPPMESLSLNLRIQKPTLLGSITFKTGTTSFHQFTLPATITIADDLPIDRVIYTTSQVLPNAENIVQGTSEVSYYSINQMGSQPQVEGLLYSTGIPGLALRVTYYSGWTAGPKMALIPSGGGSNRGWGFRFELVKTGPIALPATLPAGVLMKSYWGVNSLYCQGVQLMKSVTLMAPKRRLAVAHRA